LLIETPGHSYYHIEINPDGDIYDVDRFVSKGFTRWESQAVVKTNRGDDFWEVEVRLQLRGRLSGHILRINKYLKLVLYSLLFIAAAYWGVAGDLLDFWDAALWLFAFIFIELNVFEWHYEVAREGDTA
jgi:hypothetical protein